MQAVRDISLSVPRGIVFAIIGPNGAGKSTLLNLMSGVYQPDAGGIVFDGVDLVGRRAHQRVRLGLAPHIPENPAVQASVGARQRRRGFSYPS